ncbi:membrane-fusion protein [Vibrio mimicus]|uniref:efflux RND transporter periplasmic adaptor subunit n=1 Tax=Vibrio mimicus TaxID=674 RepID=UPI0002BADE02|nr:efflux RND transporter periplasmic adaptor subunit [Vibrio mimicus]EMB51220.1 membrane-fusion protein [Vibrio mimicus CAIM 602]MBY7674762.1 efflux RND transporter periplasmic adaptor subunit [Vibrio mimicus]MBY7726623.1 efflux RND transporter periplasmic adaptor subunit [Vibrio mimicus]TXY30700.1 efflux RND transporter periplasmic adaptor subunit [Vibrio mimicus]SUP10740.1 membrane-fusion protein [Vibrio mimicus]
MTKRWTILATLIGIGLAGGYYTLSYQQESAPSLPTLTVNRGTVEKQAVAVGQIMPSHAVAIKSQINGIVGEIYVREGQLVEQGQPLIKVRPNPTPQALTDASTELMQSEANLESDLQRLANLEHLVKQKIIPENYDDYVRAKAEVKAKKAEVQQKRQNLELIRSGEASIGQAKLSSTLYAPISGTILNIKVEVGEPIISTESSQVATEMMQLADMKNIVFKGSVSEHDAAQLISGMPAIITVAPYPEQAIEGQLTKVAIQSERLNNPENKEGQSFDNGFEVEIGQLQIPDNITLRSGFSASAQITLQRAEDVLTLPERALQFYGDTPMVLIADQSEKGYTAHPVKLGLSDGIQVEILDGVSADDSVVDNSMLGGHNE